MMSGLLEVGKQALKAQAFSSLLGTELIALMPREAVLVLRVRDDLKQQVNQDTQI